jgi:hypothetical protein
VRQHRCPLPPSQEAHMRASIFYRIAAVLLLLFAAGHTLGFRQSDPTWGVDALLASMRSIHFDVQGFNRSYWDLFQAAGFSVGVFYLFTAILAWLNPDYFVLNRGSMAFGEAGRDCSVAINIFNR